MTISYIYQLYGRIHILLWAVIFLPGFLPAQLPAPSFYQLKRDIDLFSSDYFTLAEDQYGFIWFGSHAGGGLYRFDGYSLKTFQAEPGRLKESIAGSRIRKIYAGPDSLIYIATSFGFTIMDPKSGKLTNYHNILDSLPDSRAGSISSLLRDTLHHKLWIGTHYGLASMNLENSKIKFHHTGLNGMDQAPVEITKIILDPTDANILWLGSYKGLFSYDINSDQYTRYEIPGYNNEIAIYDMHYDLDTKIWISTNRGSIMNFTPKLNSWKTIPVSTRHPVDMSVYGLLPVNENEFWVSSKTTVGRLNINSLAYESWEYNKDYPDGLLHNGEYRDILNDRHGRLWVASWHGIQYSKNALVPKSMNTGLIQVVITEIDIVPLIEEKQNPLLYTHTLQLEREQRDITLKYVLPNPLDPSRVQYRYQLKGYDKDWISTDQRSVRYSRLGGGVYVFRIQGKEESSANWSPITELTIRIDKRISEMWWFWAGMIFVAGLMAVFIYQWLIGRARKEERLKADFENKLSEIQMQALRAQMNPHFLFNSLNSIKYFAITKSKDETASYLSKFALLVRMILNNSKSRTISLKDELEAMKLYIEIEHLRLEGKFDYNIQIDKSIHITQAQIPPMILQPYVENSIWHGLMHKDDKGYLLVQVKDMGSQIQCIIEDNGIGRQRSAEIRATKMEHKASVGMQITNDRISLINKIYGIDTKVNVVDLTDQDGKPCGTRVIIHVPLIKDEEE